MKFTKPLRSMMGMAASLFAGALTGAGQSVSPAASTNINIPANPKPRYTNRAPMALNPDIYGPPTSLDKAPIQPRRIFNQRQRRKNARRAHAAGKRHAFA